ncbi:MAG: thiopurine S-methyltransferase [Candidatus Poseidonia sp.]|jgi:thiopurine S-methyltransferase|nr:thiopurine S-methyltransferase [Poseidonia sp.]
MSFWHNRWETQQIGWHREVHNDLLTKHWDGIGASDGSNVLVPLCGKTLDMQWFAEQGHAVVGSEMVHQAIETFFDEHGLVPRCTKVGSHVHHVSQPYTILEGDFFEISEEAVQADTWYDRAAMIAIPPDLREAYVEQLCKLTKEDAVGLLITFAYPPEEMDGPPFALHDEDVRRLFSEGFEVQCLETMDLTDEKDRGLSQVTSSVFRIKRV